MNVFVLSTGRCGSVTFAKACSHITNFSSAHESRIGKVIDRTEYPDNHIEIDNRISWFLGALGERYGSEAVYVHLLRDPVAVVRSFAERTVDGLSAFDQLRLAVLSLRRRRTTARVIDAFGHGLIYRRELYGHSELEAVVRAYVDTVNTNIRYFLRDKTTALTIDIDSATEEFPGFWRLIGAEGDLGAAQAELARRYNASDRR